MLRYVVYLVAIPNKPLPVKKNYYLDDFKN